MAKKKSKPKDRSAGGGAKANSEPRIQLFSKFGGVNIMNSPRDFHYTSEFTGETYDEYSQQSDLMMNQVVVQNNASVTNFTIESRQNIQTLFDAPAGKKFTGIATLIGPEMYAATDDKSIHYGVIGDGGISDFDGVVTINDVDGVSRDNTWTHLGYADDNLVGMTLGKQLWTGKVGTHEITNAKEIPNPPAMEFSQLVGKGSLRISPTITADCPFRVTLRYTYLNKYGPTLASPSLTFFASRPTVEWSGASYLAITGTAPTGYAIEALELYYTEDEYQDPAFLARVDLASRNGGPWMYNWTGYLFDTSMWAIANLSIPNQNYTSGVPASKMEVHDGQLYFWGGDPAYRLWIGGQPGNRFSISTGVGGGFVDCDPGTGMIIREVPKFKTQQGAAIVTILCDNPNSQRENRFNLIENNITISNEQSVKGWHAEKIAGTVGCKSYTGAQVAGDGLYTVSRYGLAITTLTMEYNSQLQVMYVSDAIEPVFLRQYGEQLKNSVLFTVNNVMYMTFGSPAREDDDTKQLDSVIFCYDIGLKAWWTYSLDIDEPILNMMHIDHEGNREGIGIITADHIYLLPTTRPDDTSMIPTHEVTIETAELAIAQPVQSMHHLTQLEFRFDHFIGDMEIDVVMIDQFGRTIHALKRIHHDTVQHTLSEYIRIDQVVESYKIIMRGKANMRLTHFLAKNYPKSNRIGTVWGFDSRQSHTSDGSIHRHFKSYNDLKNAIIP